MENLRLGRIDRDAEQVAVVVLIALILGCIFVVLAIPMQMFDVAAPVATARPAAAPQAAVAPVAAPRAATTSASASAASTTATPAAAPAATAGAAGAVSSAATSEVPRPASARWAGLLWAFACCAVGGFVGFIFGIPRTLSSDTARTAVLPSDSSLEAVKTKAAASKQAANTATAEKNNATKAAEIADKAWTEAKAEAARLEILANNSPGDVDAGALYAAAKQKVVDAGKKKQEAETGSEQKTTAAAHADEQEQIDQEALAAIMRGNATLPSTAQQGRGPSTAVNTNLEQISDWLTKIIVGVSLVNSEKIGNAMWQSATTMALSIGASQSASSHSLALAILVYFGVIGLLGGYLLTRLFLQRAFSAIVPTELSGTNA